MLSAGSCEQLSSSVGEALQHHTPEGAGDTALQPAGGAAAVSKQASGKTDACWGSWHHVCIVCAASPWNESCALQLLGCGSGPMVACVVSCCTPQCCNPSDVPLTAIPVTAVSLTALPLPAVPLNAGPVTAGPLTAVPLIAVLSHHGMFCYPKAATCPAVVATLCCSALYAELCVHICILPCHQTAPLTTCLTSFT